MGEGLGVLQVIRRRNDGWSRHSFDTVKVKGLYRGATSSFLGMAVESSLMFGIYSQAKLFLRGTDGDDGPRPEIIVPSAMFGGAIISFVLCPTELVEVTGMATLLRVFWKLCLFTVYEYLWYHIHSRLEGSKLKDGYLVDIGIGVLTGGHGGIACWSAKSIIQTTPDKATQTNLLKVLGSIHKRAGLKGFYAGFGSNHHESIPC